MWNVSPLQLKPNNLSKIFKLGKFYQDIGEDQQAIQSCNEAGELLENSADRQALELGSQF